MAIFWIFLFILIFIALFIITIYNQLVRYRMEAKNAWSQIDVQLKRRHDLIPNLVETVRGVMQFEKETLTKVMEARAKAMGSSSDADKMKAEGEISGYLGRLMAVWESYPDLKANKNAMALQEEIVSTENRIAYTRGHYNDVSANYNAMLEQFPSNVIASSFSFEKQVFFQVPETETAVPKVKF